MTAAQCDLPPIRKGDAYNVIVRFFSDAAKTTPFDVSSEAFEAGLSRTHLGDLVTVFDIDTTDAATGVIVLGMLADDTDDLAPRVWRWRLRAASTENSWLAGTVPVGNAFDLGDPDEIGSIDCTVVENQILDVTFTAGFLVIGGTGLAAEVAQRQAADVALDARLEALEADPTTGASVAAEADRAETEEAALGARIDDEATSRQDADDALTAAIAAGDDAAIVAAVSALAAHAADTTNVHGIADTLLLETTSGSTAKVAAHEADTTNVHGIVDTALLETTAGAIAKIAAHAAATDPHGDRAYTDSRISALLGGVPPAALDTVIELANQMLADEGIVTTLTTLVGTKETPAGAQAKADAAQAAATAAAAALVDDGSGVTNAAAFRTAIGAQQSGTCVLITDRGVAGGVATLDGSTTIPIAQIPTTIARTATTVPLTIDPATTSTTVVQNPQWVEGYANVTSSVIHGATNGAHHRILSTGSSASLLTIGGGYDNEIGDGSSNTIASTIAGGAHHVIRGSHVFIGGGSTQLAYGSYVVVDGGLLNSAFSSYNVIGGGRSNVSGVNGDTTIFDCTVAGGSSNTASGIRSTVGGGTLGIASGDSATVCGGSTGHATGDYSTVVGGANGVASGAHSTVLGGITCVAAGAESAAGGNGSSTGSSAQYAFSFGDSCSALGVGSVAFGRRAIARKDGFLAFANQQFSAIGDAQWALGAVKRLTTNATTGALGSSGAAGAGPIPMVDNSTSYFEFLVVAHRTGTSESACYILSALFRRDVGAATTRIVGDAAQKITFAEDDATWDATLTADTTNGGPLVNVTGAAAKNIQWMSQVREVVTVG